MNKFIVVKEVKGTLTELKDLSFSEYNPASSMAALLTACSREGAKYFVKRV